MENLKNDEWKAELENDPKAVIIDVRSPEEWEEGVISNKALFMNLMDAPDFQEKLNELDKSKNYYVYCRSGKRSETACRLLENNGIGQTYNLEGGILEWTEGLEDL